MMTFIMLTLSFTVAILLSVVLMLMLMLNKHVMNWYMKLLYKYMSNMYETPNEFFKEEL